MTKQNKHWGAKAMEWRRFIDIAPQDLLPVVSNPHAPISPNSKMQSTGKTPSRYNDRNEVIGIAKWTQQQTHPNQIEAWRKNKDYGVCVQTRYVRAFDIDVENIDQVDEIVNEINLYLGQKQAIRYRSNSSKRLIPFIMEGEFGKRTVKTKYGMVEFLANGQQFVAGGTHPSGVRYLWNGAKVQTITEDQFEDIWFILCEGFGIEPPTSRNARRYREGDAEILDDTANVLIEKNYVTGTGYDGQLFMECPFSTDHSTPPNGTDFAYFPAGTGGYERGHFVCLHASCEHRVDDDFADALGVYDDEFKGEEFEALAKKPEYAVKERPKWDVTKYGQPKATLQNLELALQKPHIFGYEIRYDKFTDNIIFFDPEDKGKWQVATDALYVNVRRHLEEHHNFIPIGKEIMRDAILSYADKNDIDTAIEWLNALEWDGVKRIDNFMHDYMGCDDTPYTRAVSRYVWTGLAGRVLEPGMKADMIPVLKSPEGYRKSTAVEAIAPTIDQFTEIDFSEKDADLARLMRGKLVAEIAELRGLRTRDLEGILAFVTRRVERWVPKFKEFSTTFPRRLLFFATTNESEFLDGSRKHRRWLPLEVKRNTDVDAIKRDRKQLWAEAKVMFLKHGLLYEEADNLAHGSRDDFRIKDMWEEVIEKWLHTPNDLDGDKTPANQDYIMISDVARFALNMEPKSLKRYDELKLANCLRALGYEPHRAYIDGKQQRAWKKNENTRT